MFLNPCDNKKYKNIIQVYNGKVLYLVKFHVIRINIVTFYDFVFYSSNLNSEACRKPALALISRTQARSTFEA